MVKTNSTVNLTLRKFSSHIHWGQESEWIYHKFNPHADYKNADTSRDEIVFELQTKFLAFKGWFHVNYRLSFIGAFVSWHSFLFCSCSVVLPSLESQWSFYQLTIYVVYMRWSLNIAQKSKNPCTWCVHLK